MRKGWRISRVIQDRNPAKMGSKRQWSWCKWPNKQLELVSTNKNLLLIIFNLIGTLQYNKQCLLIWIHSSFYRRTICTCQFKKVNISYHLHNMTLLIQNNQQCSQILFLRSVIKENLKNSMVVLRKFIISWTA